MFTFLCNHMLLLGIISSVVGLLLVILVVLFGVEFFFPKMVGSGGSGSKWKGTLYYINEKMRMGKYKDGEIKNAFHFLKDRQDIVSAITYYHQGSFLFHHDFVVLNVSAPDGAKGFWSVEKLTSGITVQFGKQLSTVKNFWTRRKVDTRDNVRAKSSQIINNKQFHLFNLIRILFNHEELENNYTPILHNCRGFAKEVYNSLTNADRVSTQLVAAGVRPLSRGVTGVFPRIASFPNHAAFRAYFSKTNTNANANANTDDVEDYNEFSGFL